MRVFVSYTSKDPVLTDEKLRQVECRIKPFARVFIDRLHNIKRKQCRVNIELRYCDEVLCLVSEQYKSQWVQKELVKARKSNKPVIKIGVNELLALDDEQLYTLLTDVEKKTWSVWLFFGLSLLACLAISLIGIWASYCFVSAHLVQKEGTDIFNARGLFGDSWGGVNAIISAFAFAGVIVTLFLQNRDLNLQRKEMARQREEFEKENETLKYQRFENLFYNMLNLQQEIVAGLRYNYKEEETVLVPMGPDASPLQDRRMVERVVVGREVFRYTFDKAEILLSETDSYGNRKRVYGYRGFLKAKGLMAYDDTWIPTIFDHYFRHLYKIVQFVDIQGFAYNEAYKYVSLLRGTLSRYELVWIYYNALNPVFRRFQELIEKYSLLKNLREDLLTQSKELITYYNGLGLTLKDVKDATFTSTDLELYLTDDRNDAEKYFVTAFWKDDEKEQGLEWLQRWRLFVSDAEKRVREKI